MLNRLIATSIRCGLIVVALSIATSAQAYGQYWSSVYVCPGYSQSQLPGGYTFSGDCILDGNGYTLGTALVGTSVGADSMTALSFADESYQVIEVHATFRIEGDTYAQGRFCDYQNGCYDMGSGIYMIPYAWAMVW